MNNGATSEADSWKLWNTCCRFLHFRDFMIFMRDFVQEVSWHHIHNSPAISNVLSKHTEASGPSACYQTCSLADQNYRMVCTFVLDGTFKDRLVQPLPWAGTSLTRSGCSKPGFKHFQGWGTHNLSGKPVPTSHNPHHKNISSLYLIYIYPLSV